MSRVFISPQAGRSGRAGSVVPDEEPWGTTSSQAQYRAYEAAEVSSCRSNPAQALLQHGQPLGSSRGGMARMSGLGSTVGSVNVGERRRRAPSTAAASSALSKSSSRARSQPSLQPQQPQQHIPFWKQAEQRPMPNNPFLGNSHSREHEAEAQKARKVHFPYRDEFAPRSKRLMYELVLAKQVEEDGQSTDAGSESCFTVSTQARSKMSRATSTPALPAIPGTPPLTAGSHRLPGGAGRLARRRYECQFKAPSLWPADENWYRETYERDGPAGMTTLNYPGHLHNGKLSSQNQMLVQCHAMISYPDDEKQ
mmetsp:Transcript_44995/g.96629  ORF Transcript_44995/g.96629 Transcript_44995/m.96629 type:complete len:310 (+) Transcript_44995:83-1012(+)